MRVVGYLVEDTVLAELVSQPDHVRMDRLDDRRPSDRPGKNDEALGFLSELAAEREPRTRARARDVRCRR